MSDFPKEFDTEMEAMQWMMSQPSGGLVHMTIVHDDLCLGSPGGGCTCTPVYVLDELTTERLIEGARGEAKWANRHKNN